MYIQLTYYIKILQTPLFQNITNTTISTIHIYTLSWQIESLGHFSHFFLAHAIWLESHTF